MKPSAHGNSLKLCAPVYVRTKESTINTLRCKVIRQTPKEAYHSGRKDKGLGGTLKAKALSDLPRYKAKAKYQRRCHFHKKILGQY